MRIYDSYIDIDLQRHGYVCHGLTYSCNTLIYEFFYSLNGGTGMPFLDSDCFWPTNPHSSLYKHFGLEMHYFEQEGEEDFMIQWSLNDYKRITAAIQQSKALLNLRLFSSPSPSTSPSKRTKQSYLCLTQSGLRLERGYNSQE